MPGWYRAPRGRARKQSTILAPLVSIDHPGAAARAISELESADFNCVHVQRGEIDSPAFVAELDQLRNAALRISAITCPVNALAPQPLAGTGSAAEKSMGLVLAWIETIRVPAERPLLILPSGWRPTSCTNTIEAPEEFPSYSPRERGIALRTLQRWLAQAVRRKIQVAVQPARDQVLQSAVASHRFMLENASPSSGLALSPRSLLPSGSGGEALLRLLLDLVPWSRLLYIEGGEAWDDDSTDSRFTSRILARALRAPGVPPRLSISGVSPARWKQAGEEIQTGFSSLGLELDLVS